MPLEAAPWTIWENGQPSARVDGFENHVPIDPSDYDPNEDARDSSGNDLPDHPRQNWYTYKFLNSTCHRIHIKPEFLRNPHMRKHPTEWVVFLSPDGEPYNLSDYFVDVPRVRRCGALLLMEASLRLKIARCDRYEIELRLNYVENNMLPEAKADFDRAISDLKTVCSEEKYSVEDIIMAGGDDKWLEEHEIITTRHMEAFGEAYTTCAVHQRLLQEHAELEAKLRETERQYELLKRLAREVTMPMRRARRGPEDSRWRVYFGGSRRDVRDQYAVWNRSLVPGEQLMPGEIHLRLDVNGRMIEHL